MFRKGKGETEAVKKTSKTETVEALKAAIAAQRGAVVASFRGLKVSEMTALRKKLRAIDAELKVVKNTLIRRAAEGTPFGDLSAHFTGPTAVAFCHGDPVALAKAMKEFAAATPKVTLRAGFVEGRVLSAKEVETLASVPSRDVLLSRLVGGLASPITRLAQALSGPPRKLVYVLESIRKQKPAEAAAG
ncbi:MAG TPA: 50S ribosomal protein L10 [Deltaproteobacteria bacterium]|nr:50S ribosomal protein L10 [Deltaproteobacteria bacterium]HBG72383.1 50S ribosomal protein L10 [Deltaproteobacteria bacterium]